MTEVPHELRIMAIRGRARHADGQRSPIAAVRDRQFLIEEVDRLARALFEAERDADRRIYIETVDVRTQRDMAMERADQMEARYDRVTTSLATMNAKAESWEGAYRHLSQSVAHLINGKVQHSDHESLLAAMASKTARMELEFTERAKASTQALDEALELVRSTDAALEAERGIRRRVHERFKRMRREVILASETIKHQRREILGLKHKAMIESELGSAARKFAALAYRALESEDLEDRGQEPMWP